jgi:hypothetical protein
MFIATVTAAVNGGGTEQVVASAPYDDTHRFWQFREACGVLFWETSADGSVWTALHQVASATLFDMAYARVRLGADSATGAATGTTGRFDDLNGEPEVAACPMRDFVDDFGDGSFAGVWSRNDETGCTATEPGGVLLMQMQTAVNSRCRLTTSEGFDMREDAVTVQVVQHPSGGTPANCWLVAQPEPGRGYIIGYETGTLFMGRLQNEAYINISSRGFVENEMAWWRLREAGGTTFFETAPDGVTWTERASTANLYDMSEIAVSIGSLVEAPIGTGFDVRFDNLNTLP